MRLRRLLLPAGAAAAAASALWVSGALLPRPALRPAQAATPQRGNGPSVALLITRPGAPDTSLYLVRAGDSSTGPPVATFDHIEDATVRGSVLPGTDVVLATADTARTREASFAGSLFRLAPHRPPERLADRIVHASRPLVTASGRAFVSRGKAGPEHAARQGVPRIDELTIDEIDPATGAARTVHASSGHLLLLAGAFGREILVYRVGPAGADLAAVDADSGAVRLLVPQLLPYARDFSVDEGAGALVFQGRDDINSRAYTIERVDLGTAARRRLYTSTSMNLAPFAWPGGGVAYSHEGRAGLALLGGARPLIPGLLGAGVDQIQATSAGGAWVAGLHTVAGRPPVPFAIDTRTGEAARLPVPEGARAFVAGFTGASP